MSRYPFSRYPWVLYSSADMDGERGRTALRAEGAMLSRASVSHQYPNARSRDVRSTRCHAVRVSASRGAEENYRQRPPSLPCADPVPTPRRLLTAAVALSASRALTLYCRLSGHVHGATTMSTRHATPAATRLQAAHSPRSDPGQGKGGGRGGEGAQRFSPNTSALPEVLIYRLPCFGRH